VADEARISVASDISHVIRLTQVLMDFSTIMFVHGRFNCCMEKLAVAPLFMENVIVVWKK